MANLRTQRPLSARVPPDQQSQMPLAFQFIEKPAEVQQQERSPLYSRLVPEIRELIWQHALQQYEDESHQVDMSKRWVRPGRFGHLRIALDLLLTCKAIYVETFCLPIALNTVYVFDGDTKDRPPANPLHTSVYDIYDSLRMKPWQFAAISRVDLTVQQTMLEGGALERCSRNLGVLKRHQRCRIEGSQAGGYPMSRHLTKVEQEVPHTPRKTPFAFHELSMDRLCIGAPITHLTIRLNRTDWWTWSDHPDTSDVNKLLRLEPQIHYSCPPHNNLAMDEGREARRSGKEPDFRLDSFEAEGRWGQHITEHWPDLQILELVFETFQEKEAQLDNVVSSAKLWRFAMPGGTALEFTTDRPKLFWQGAAKYGYETHAPWALRPPTSLPVTTRRAAQSLWSRVTGTSQQGYKQISDDGQRFVLASLLYERRRSTGKPIE